MKAIVLAGGFGTRLQERVPDVPKPLAPVAGRPFLEYVLNHLIGSGIHEIILSVGYRADLIMGHFGDTYRNAVVSYSVETEPLGTGGAIAHALRQEGDGPVLVLNGDTFLNVDYRKLIRWYKQTPVQVAMVLKEVSDVARYGSVLTTGERISGFVEKGKAEAGLINAGVYIVQPSVFGTFSLSGKFSFERDLLQRHCNALSPRAFLTDAYFIDIGVPADYDRSQHDFLSYGNQATRTFY